MEEYFKVRGIHGHSTLNQAAHDEYQEALANRRASGRYTLEEAALFISDASGERADELLCDLMNAARRGVLSVYEPGKNKPYTSYVDDFASRVREFYHEARWCDLNKWLEGNAPLILASFPDPVIARTRVNGASAGLPKHEILAVDWPLPQTAPKLKDILDNLPKWVDGACTKVGRSGKGPDGSHLWNPAILAVCLATKAPRKKWPVVGKGTLTNFLSRHFSDYLDEWKEASQDL